VIAFYTVTQAFNSRERNDTLIEQIQCTANVAEVKIQLYRRLQNRLKAQQKFAVDQVDRGVRSLGYKHKLRFLDLS